MGCSSSMNQPSTEDKQPLKCSNVFTDKNDLSMLVQNNKTNNPISGTDNSSKPRQFNPTHIVIISRDSTIVDSTDSSNVVPIMPYDRSGAGSPNSERLGSGASKQSRSQSLPGGIKSVLKTRRGNQAHDHIVTQRPIKNVTFMENVTVLTVY